MHLVVLEGTKHLFGMPAVFHAANFHEEYGHVAADAETPKAALREGILRQQGVAVVAEGGCLGHIFGHTAVEAHLAALEEGEAVAHVVEHRGRLESMLDVSGALVLLGELQQVLARFGIAGEDIGFGALVGRDMQATAHAHHGVEGSAHGAREGAAALDDVGVTETVAATEELQSRGFVLDKAVALVDPEAVQHIAA